MSINRDYRDTIKCKRRWADAIKPPTQAEIDDPQGFNKPKDIKAWYKITILSMGVYYRADVSHDWLLRKGFGLKALNKINDTINRQRVLWLISNGRTTVISKDLAERLLLHPVPIEKVKQPPRVQRLRNSDALAVIRCPKAMWRGVQRVAQSTNSSGASIVRQLMAEFLYQYYLKNPQTIVVEINHDTHVVTLEAGINHEESGEFQADIHIGPSKENQCEIA